jgi:CheY-like chemotaxis protein
MPDQITVLVAEDEKLVRLVIAEVLRDEGFEVIEVEHAEAALAILQIHAARIHVLFTDIQMPGTMNGLALAHHAASHWPRIALLITSARPLPDRAALPKKSRFCYGLIAPRGGNRRPHRRACGGWPAGKGRKYLARDATERPTWPRPNPNYSSNRQLIGVTTEYGIMRAW